MTTAKPFEITKQSVWEAWKSVKKNYGSHGIDFQSIEDFESNLKDNLYKLWNRMSSGSYIPPAVRQVEIPKKDGGIRILGIPTVADRIAQTVVKNFLEPQLDPTFHPDSYGYRPNKSALDAVAITRERCWEFKWVIDLDIKGFFDNMNHDLVMKALKKHTTCKWVLLYVERWLKVPMENHEGQQIIRTKGTPQGGVISPLLANLFMHYAFDKWMERTFPNVVFARYADDVVIHCISFSQAGYVRDTVNKRLKECHLELHPLKTKIVFCRHKWKDVKHEVKSFDFLGYTFRIRGRRNNQNIIKTIFLPAISYTAKNTIQGKVRKWEIHRWTRRSIEEIAETINPVIRGWINYYCKFYESEALNVISRAVNSALIKWAKRKYKKFRHSYVKSTKCIENMWNNNRGLFAHWRLQSCFVYKG